MSHNLLNLVIGRPEQLRNRSCWSMIAQHPCGRGYRLLSAAQLGRYLDTSSTKPHLDEAAGLGAHDRPQAGRQAAHKASHSSPGVEAHRGSANKLAQGMSCACCRGFCQMMTCSSALPAGMQCLLCSNAQLTLEQHCCKSAACSMLQHGSLPVTSQTLLRTKLTRQNCCAVLADQMPSMHSSAACTSFLTMQQNFTSDKASGLSLGSSSPLRPLQIMHSWPLAPKICHPTQVRPVSV